MLGRSKKKKKVGREQGFKIQCTQEDIVPRVIGKK